MDIQVWSDVVCPWCYLGKRRLESALREFGHGARVTYRAFQLDPAPVPHPLPVKEAMAAKVGGPERVSHVTALARADGLALDLDRAILANTFDSHRLIVWAAGHGRQADMVDALQQAHFSQGVDIGSRPALAWVAGLIGLDRAAAAAYLESDAGTDAVHADLAAARDFGITSVPTFLFNGRYAMHGAQESTTLLSAIREIARRTAVDAGR